ncbi:MAG TPA: glycosyltransferase family 39 protein [Chthoniobacterales bacterium]|nr:glycosyltransferase family 39 protein [Chthoniobacterales bacterium]
MTAKLIRFRYSIRALLQNSKQRWFLPLVAPFKNWGRWEQLTLLGLLLAFTAFATYQIHSPGLYMDEMDFVGAATGKQPYRGWLGIPLMVFPYIGALKAWTYIPIFALFGVSAASIRLPVVLISCGTLALGYALVRRTLTPGWATAFTAACVVHPDFVLQTKVDWGPVVLMLFFKALCLYLLVKWLETPRLFSWSLAGAITACGLGFFDKFNFIWFVVALFGATLVVYWRAIHAKLTGVPRHLVAAIAVAMVAAGALVLLIVLPLVQPPDMQSISRRIWQIWSLYEFTSAGGATAFLWFKRSPDIPLWPGWAVAAATAIFLLLALAFYRRRPGSDFPVHSGALRFCIWCLLMFAAIFVQIVLTPQAGGPHHTLMLFPLDLLACFAAAFLFTNTLSVRKRYVATLLGGIVLLIWAGSEMQSLQSHFRRFRDVSAFRGAWSPRVELLADYLNINGKHVDAIYCVDWGIGHQLAALCQPDIARKIRDRWPGFKDWSAQKPDAGAAVKATFLPQVKALYLTFTEENSVFPEARRNFLQMNSLAGNAAQPVTLVPPALGEVYQVFESGTDVTGEPAPLDTASALTPPAASIGADPNPVPAGHGSPGRTTINWHTNDGTIGEVYVVTNGSAETLFASGSNGPAEAPWIMADSRYEFRLRSGTDHKTLLGRVIVTRAKN